MILSCKNDKGWTVVELFERRVWLDLEAKEPKGEIVSQEQLTKEYKKALNGLVG